MVNTKNKTMDFIQGELFTQLADFIYAPQDKEKDDHDKNPCTVNWGGLKDVNVICTHNMYVVKLLNIIKHFKEKFIIITPSSDCRIEEQGVVIPDGRSGEGVVLPYVIPDNLIRWYSTNVNVKHSKIMSIPIGVENSRWQGNPPKKE